MSISQEASWRAAAEAARANGLPEPTFEEWLAQTTAPERPVRRERPHDRFIPGQRVRIGWGKVVWQIEAVVRYESGGIAHIDLNALERPTANLNGEVLKLTRRVRKMDEINRLVILP